MGILSRISKVLESNLNAIVDRAEDPGKMLDQAIEDMRRGRHEARQAIIEAKTQKRLLEKKRDKAKAESIELERKAMQALKGSDESLAKKFLEMKIAADQRVEAEGTAISEQDSQISHLQTAEKELERKLDEMPAKRAALLARQSAAQAKGARVGATSKAHNSVSAALDAFERMEWLGADPEVEAEVVGDGHPALPENASLESLKAEEALLALKSKMTHQLASGEPESKAEPQEAQASPPPAAAPEPEAPAPDPVSDSLAELKAKLNQQG